MVEGGRRGYRGNVCILRDLKGIYINRAEVILHIVIKSLQNKAKRPSEHDATEQQTTAKNPNTEPSNLTTKICTNTINQIAKPNVMNVASSETKNKQIRTRETCQTQAGFTDKNLQKSKSIKHDQFVNNKKQTINVQNHRENVRQTSKYI